MGNDSLPDDRTSALRGQGPSLSPRFVADRMLGRLARMLRLLGYDTAYSPGFTPSQMARLARDENRILLTRGNAEKRFPGLDRVVTLGSDYPPEQLRDVAERLSLDTTSGLWTRCTLCNGGIVRVEKNEVVSCVEPKVFEIYQEFFRCSACGHIYWRGSHVERILKNLSSLLGKGE